MSEVPQFVSRLVHRCAYARCQATQNLSTLKQVWQLAAKFHLVEHARVFVGH
jgi:hypothetical protein